MSSPKPLPPKRRDARPRKRGSPAIERGRRLPPSHAEPAIKAANGVVRLGRGQAIAMEIERALASRSARRARPRLCSVMPRCATYAAQVEAGETYCRCRARGATAHRVIDHGNRSAESRKPRVSSSACAELDRPLTKITAAHWKRQENETWTSSLNAADAYCRRVTPRGCSLMRASRRCAQLDDILIGDVTLTTTRTSISEILPYWRTMFSAVGHGGRGQTDRGSIVPTMRLHPGHGGRGDALPLRRSERPSRKFRDVQLGERWMTP